MTITLTPNISLKKLEYRDTDYPDWGTVENSNMNTLDLAIGDFQYTEENYVTSSTPPTPSNPITVVESHSESLNNLDINLEIYDLRMPTADERAALIGEGTPTGTNLYVTKSYARPARKKILFPEATGAVLTPAPGGANIGNMTSIAMAVGNYIFNYYQWLSSSVVAIQSYDISIQWRVPETFLGFTLTANKALTVDICTQENAITNNKVDVIIKKDGIATTSSMIDKYSTVADTWYAERKGNEKIGFDRTDTVLSTLVAGDTLDITIRVYSWNKYVKIGAVTVQYTG